MDERGWSGAKANTEILASPECFFGGGDGSVRGGVDSEAGRIVVRAIDCGYGSRDMMVSGRVSGRIRFGEVG